MNELDELLRDRRAVAGLMQLSALEIDPSVHEQLKQDRLDRLELEQYRAIFAALDKLLERGGSFHGFRSVIDGRPGLRVISRDGQPGEQVDTVSGATLRDALAQAAQVVA